MIRLETLKTELERGVQIQTFADFFNFPNQFVIENENDFSQVGHRQHDLTSEELDFAMGRVTEAPGADANVALANANEAEENLFWLDIC